MQTPSSTRHGSGAQTNYFVFSPKSTHSPAKKGRNVVGDFTAASVKNRNGGVEKKLQFSTQ